jgi:hypothetical protein
MKVALMQRVMLVFGVFMFTSLCAAQEAAKPEEAATGRIFGRVWHTKVRMEDGFKYMNSVREELEIPASPITMIMSGNMDMGPGRFRQPNDDAAEIEMKGTLFFLQLTPEVSLNNPISFELVGDQEAFTAAVNEQGSMMGPACEIIGEDDRYEVKLDFAKLATAAAQPQPVQDDSEPGEKKTTRSMSIVVTSSISTTEDGSAPAAIPTSMSTYFRYVDGIMYSSRSKAVFTIELPTREGLKLSDEDAGHDVYADFDLTQIPANMKQAFWTALEGQASVFLQRFDNEAEGEYSLRRILAEGRLELLQRALFDIDRARLSLKFAADGEPIVSQLRISARENSALASVLGVISQSGSQHAVLQDEDSPLVLSSAMVIPDFVRPFAAAFVNSVNLRLKDAAAENPGTATLIDDLTRPLQDTITEGILDTSICLRGNVKDGLIPCAAIRLNGAEEFVSVLKSVLQATAARESLTVTTGTSGDYTTLAIRTKQTQIPLAKANIPIQLHLCGTGSWLWVTMGDDRASKMLDELVAKQGESSGSAGQASPLLVRFKLNQWMGESGDELSKVPAQWLESAERWLMKTTSPKMSISVNGQNSEKEEASEDEFTAYAAKALKPEDSEFELRVRTAEQELVVDAKAGEGLARFAVAQFLDAQNRMFKGMSFDFSLPGEGGNVRTKGTFRIGVGAPPKE